MLCKIADLLVEVPATGDMPQRCEKYLYTGEGQPDIVIEASEYNPERWPTLTGAGLDYMESGTLFFLRLLQFNGMMLHSSAIEYEGKAYSVLAAKFPYGGEVEEDSITNDPALWSCSSESNCGTYFYEWNGIKMMAVGWMSPITMPNQEFLDSITDAIVVLK